MSVTSDPQAMPPQPAAIQRIGQARRGVTGVNSGRGERIADLVMGGALVGVGLWRRSVLGGVLAATGGWLLYAGVTGRFSPYAALGLVRARRSSMQGLVVERSITIGKPRDELYRFWRDVANLPMFLSHLESVTEQSDRRSHWTAKAPLGRRAEWDAVITEDQPSTMIAWRSLPDATITNHGQVRFSDAPGGRGTELFVRLVYEPPLGTAGAALAKLFQDEPTQEVEADLRRLKAILESGEAPTVQEQPHGTLKIGPRRR